MDEENKGSQPVAGWVFKPGSAPTPAVTPVTAEAVPVNQYQYPQGQPGQTEMPAVQPGLPDATTQLPVPEDALVSWTASEYIANPKNMGWFIALGLGSVALIAFIYLFTRDIVSVVAIGALGIIVGVFAARQPRELTYALDPHGVHMGTRYYPYGTFKSFSVVPDGEYSHISLMPLKRFMPAMAVHFAPSDEDKVIKTLGDYLPYEEHKGDIVENLSRKVRF